MLEKDGTMNAEIAYSCGFASESHFCTSFKLITGMTATAWRRMVAATAASLGALWTDFERVPIAHI